MPIKTVQANSMNALDKKVGALEGEGWVFSHSWAVADRYKGGLLTGLSLTSCHYYATMMRSVTLPPVATNLLLNPGFEDSTYEQFPGHGNIKVPLHWKLWFTHGERKCTNSEILERQPEAGLIGLSVDPVRVQSGNFAFKAHTYCGCHNMRLYQTVETERGKDYEFSLFMHSWYSNCTARPHDVPYEEDGKTKATYAWSELQVGIDPLGLDDPESHSIKWTEPDVQYGGYGAPFYIAAQAMSDQLTAVASSWTGYPLKHEDWYVDSARLVQRR